MRVRRVPAYFGALSSLRGAPLREAIERVLGTCGLEERADSSSAPSPAASASGSVSPRLCLHDPKVLILDEPTIGLDPNQIREVRSLIKCLAGEHTVMLSTHILPEAEATCQRVIIINRGRIVAEDTSAALTSQIRSAETIQVRVRGGDDKVAKKLLRPSRRQGCPSR